MVSLSLLQRFWTKVDVGGPDDCWEWKAGRDQGNYGMFWYEGRTVHAQRVAWLIAHGKFPERIFTCHECDNPPCCNPKHLFLGTSQDNHRDMRLKGRIASGDRHGSRTHPHRWYRGEDQHAAKLTDTAVRSIRQRYATGEITQTQLARQWGVSQSVVWRVIHNYTWKHVDLGEEA